MVHVCRLMVSDFEHGTGRFNGGDELYDNYNLKCGLTYALDYLNIGVTHCPVQHFDLRKFSTWCARKLQVPIKTHKPLMKETNRDGRNL